MNRRDTFRRGATMLVPLVVPLTARDLQRPADDVPPLTMPAVRVPLPAQNAVEVTRRQIERLGWTTEQTHGFVAEAGAWCWSCVAWRPPRGSERSRQYVALRYPDLSTRTAREALTVAWKKIHYAVARDWWTATGIERLRARGALVVSYPQYVALLKNNRRFSVSDLSRYTRGKVYGPDYVGRLGTRKVYISNWVKD